MLAFLAKPLFCSTLLFYSTAHTGILQSPIEDRTHKEEKTEKPVKGPKRTVWNLDGGVFFSTDGHLPNGSCFRLSGHMTAPDFFDGLRRVDTTDGTTYVLHEKVVTVYPPELFLTLHLLDFPCTFDLKETVVRPPLTREIMSTLRLNFFWKDGIAMRPVETSKRTAASVKRLAPYAADAASELAPRFEWNYAFTVAGENVPLTTDLVLVIETEDHTVAARLAASL